MPRWGHCRLQVPKAGGRQMMTVVAQKQNPNRFGIVNVREKPAPDQGRHYEQRRDHQQILISGKGPIGSPSFVTR